MRVERCDWGIGFLWREQTTGRCRSRAHLRMGEAPEGEYRAAPAYNRRSCDAPLHRAAIIMRTVHYNWLEAFTSHRTPSSLALTGARQRIDTNLTTPALASNDSFSDSAPPTVTHSAAGRRERRPSLAGVKKASSKACSQMDQVQLSAHVSMRVRRELASWRRTSGAM